MHVNKHPFSSVMSLYRCLQLKTIFFGPTFIKVQITMFAFKRLNIRNLFQVRHLETHECFTDRERIEGIFHQKAFLQFFHTEKIQELSLDNALNFCDCDRKCLPEVVGEWFQNPMVLSRIAFEINFTHFTDRKGASGDCCRTSVSKVKRGEKNLRERKQPF